MKNETNDIIIVKLAEKPHLKERAAQWFADKWGVPLEAYLASMDASFSAVVPSWYLCLDGEKIVAGAGVIENDFHVRRDLTPNVCAVYTEAEYRNRGLASAVLDYVCKDMQKQGIDTLYLVTDHTGFYERYGWEFFCMVQEENADSLARMYVHHCR